MKIAIRVLFAVVVVAALAAALLAHTTYRVYAVQTGSMRPNIPAKSLVVVEPGHYKMGQPITFHIGHEVVTHRLVGENSDGTYVTKGDANDTADATPVPAQDIIGGVVVSQPELGFWLVYITRPLGAASIAVSLVLLYLIWGFGTATPPSEPALPDPSVPPDPERAVEGVGRLAAGSAHAPLPPLPGELGGRTLMLANIWGLEFLDGAVVTIDEHGRSDVRECEHQEAEV